MILRKQKVNHCEFQVTMKPNQNISNKWSIAQATKKKSGFSSQDVEPMTSHA